MSSVVKYSVLELKMSPVKFAKLTGGVFNKNYNIRQVITTFDFGYVEFNPYLIKNTETLPVVTNTPNYLDIIYNRLDSKKDINQIKYNTNKLFLFLKQNKGSFEKFGKWLKRFWKKHNIPYTMDKGDNDFRLVFPNSNLSKQVLKGMGFVLDDKKTYVYTGGRKMSKKNRREELDLDDDFVVEENEEMEESEAEEKPSKKEKKVKKSKKDKAEKKVKKENKVKKSKKEKSSEDDSSEEKPSKKRSRKKEVEAEEKPSKKEKKVKKSKKDKAEKQEKPEKSTRGRKPKNKDEKSEKKVKKEKTTDKVTVDSIASNITKNLKGIEGVMSINAADVSKVLGKEASKSVMKKLSKALSEKFTTSVVDDSVCVWKKSKKVSASAMK